MINVADTNAPNAQVVALSLAEAELRLSQLRPRPFPDQSELTVKVLALAMSCFLVALLAAYLVGRGAMRFIVAIEVVIWLLMTFLVFAQTRGILLAVRRMRQTFYDSIEDRARRDGAIIDGLAANGLPWIKERRARLAQAADAQSSHATLLLGKVASGGIVPIVISVYMAFRTRQLPLDFGTSPQELLAIAFVIGTCLGYIGVHVHQRRVRDLSALLEIAELRLQSQSDGVPLAADMADLVESNCAEGASAPIAESNRPAHAASIAGMPGT